MQNLTSFPRFDRLFGPAGLGNLLLLACCFLFFGMSRTSAQNGCAALTPTFINYEPCKYRVRISNTSECTPFIRFALESATFSDYSVNTAGGWTGTLVAPNEILMTHISGIVPIGVSFPLLFTLPPGISTAIDPLWEFTCDPGMSCFLFPAPILESCPDPQDASISGVKYRSCSASPYSNQPTLPGWPIQLLAEDGVTLISETETDATGSYAFYDLPLGQYIIKESAVPGWSPALPASGQAQVNLAASQQLVQNFGNCPACACDAIYTEILQLPSAASPCSYVLNVSSTAPAGCFTQMNIATAAGSFGSVTAGSGWSAILVDSQHIRATYTGGFLPPGISQPCFFSASSASGSQEFTVTTSYTLSGQTQTCTRAAGPFPCPAVIFPSDCCPAGSTLGPELVTNPNFQLGYTGFTNGYTAVPGGSPMTSGNASVANQAQAYASNNQWSCIDHTAFNAADFFLAVDGYAAPVVWQQTNVNVTAGTTYSFRAWVRNLVRPISNFADPTVSLWINNTQQVAGPITLPENNGQWSWICGTYTAQQTGPVTIAIRMAAGSSLGNDLAIDDISFRACVPPAPCQISINVVPINNCGLVQVVATSSGQLPISYQWCAGPTVNAYTTQLPCGPHTFCVTATCPDGSTATASMTYVVSDPIPPTCVTVPGFGVALNQNCSYTLTPQQIDGGSTDNCFIQNLSISPTVLTGCGVTTVTLTVTDWCGNTSTCSTGVQTIETVPPVITNCPTAPVPVTTNPGVCYYQGPLPTLTATDNCGTVTNFSCNWFTNNTFVPITAATQFPKGNNTIRCQAIDNCGNTSLSCTYTLLVEDKEKPTIICPQNVHVIGSINAVGQCKAIVNNIAAVASDNCPMLSTSWVLSGATTGNGNGDASGTNFMQGTTTVTYTATDMAGNTSTCSFTVNVVCSQWACDCPQGSTNGPDLIDNGTFQLGNTLFSSGYAPLPPSCSPQEYAVTDPVQVTTLCNNWAATDHTTGNATAGWLFFAADGAMTPGIDAWRQQVTLTAGTTYKFCAWVKNLNFNLDRPDPIVEAYILDVSLNPIGPPIATTGLLPEPALPSGWVMIMGSFTATAPGTHHVAIRTAGTSFEGNNFALDDIAFRACTPLPPSCTCPPNAFTNMSYKQNSGPNVPINCGDLAIWQCQFPTFNLSGNFMCQGNNCPSPIPMSWVLKNGANVPVDNGTMTAPSFLVSIPNASFATPGVYTLTLTGICGTDTCTCDIRIETPGCGNNCSCGQVNSASIHKTWDWWAPITCNNFNNPVTVPCLKPGQNYFIHGNFPCSSASCANGPVTWTLNRPSPLPPVSGTASSWYPHFDILMAGSHFTQPGIYTLTVTQFCGTTPCTCTFVFEVEACRCKCTDLPPVAVQGFNVAGSILNCKRTFTPQASLCANDQVYWFVNFGLVGTTTGSAPFMYNFPSGGGYWVCMLVERTDPMTGQKCYYARCRFIKVKCLFGPDPYVCETSVVRNGNFDEAVTPGELGNGGALTDWAWFPNAGYGSVFVDSTGGGHDSGFLVFNGGQNNFGAAYQQIDLAAGSNFVNLEYQYNNLQGEQLPAGTVLEFRLHAEPVPGSPNQVLYTHQISTDTSEAGWQNRFVSLPAQVNPDYKYLIVCLRNDAGDQQSLVALDNLSVCGSQSMLTGANEVPKNTTIRLFPNPSAGAFTIELSEPATADMRFRVLDLTGRLVAEQVAQIGSDTQFMDMHSVPNGLYFLQVLESGRLVAMEKFVVQGP
jgi:hypothetical protein